MNDKLHRISTSKYEIRYLSRQTNSKRYTRSRALTIKTIPNDDANRDLNTVKLLMRYYVILRVREYLSTVFERLYYTRRQLLRHTGTVIAAVFTRFRK